MVRKELSSEAIIELSSSPYVKSIKSGQVSFTSEFKQILYDELAQGKLLRNVLEEHGINPDILGDRRIYKLAERLRQQGKREGGFSDLRKKNCYKPAGKTETQALTAQVEKLRHELVYAQQEIEFLKKIHMAELEVQKSWKSKQRRK